MNTKLLFALGLGGTALALLANKGREVAKNIDGITVDMDGFRFRDTIGIPGTKSFKARFEVDLKIFNPTGLSAPLTLSSVILNLNGQEVARLASTPKTYQIGTNFTQLNNLIFEVPANLKNIATISTLRNPKIIVNYSVYGVKDTKVKTF